MKTRLSLPVVIFTLSAFAVGISMAASPARISASFTVNSVADATDANPGNGVCEAAPGNGVCTLRAAIQETNALAGSDTIVLPPGVYTVTIVGKLEDNSATGDFDVKGNLTISGAGAAGTVIDGGGFTIQDRAFHIFSSATVNISNLTIQNGRPGSMGGGGGIFINPGGELILTSSIVSDNTSYAGGGIQVGGSLTLVGSIIRNNTGTSLGGGGVGIGTGNIMTVTNSSIISNTSNNLGGGIRNYGTLIIDNSTISSNVSPYSGGGGIANHGTLSLRGSTVSGNSSADFGGGILTYFSDSNSTIINSTINDNSSGGRGGGIATDSGSTLTIVNSTVTSNTAGIDGGGVYNSTITSLNSVTLANNTADNDVNGSGEGGGVYSAGFGASVNFHNTIIAGNVDTGGEAPDCAGTLNSQDYNLIQDTTGCVITGTATHNITSQSPNLGPLQNNGGLTFTRALLAGSPAIDAGDNVTCVTADQRGFARPLDGDGNSSAICDIGAFEFGHIVRWVYLALVVRNQ